MSTIKFASNASGSGSVTIASPNTNSDVTLALPDGSGTLLFANTGGNVGIGTNSPSRQLTIVNAATTGTASDNCSILVSSTNRTGFIQLDSVSGGNGNSSVVFSAGGVEQGRVLYRADSNYMTFSTATTERIRIDSSGNVGVGTSLPDGRLRVQSAGAYNGPVASRTSLQLSTENAAGGFGSTRIQWTFGALSNGTKSWIEGSVYGNDYLAIGYDASEHVRFAASGNVGIGTSSPELSLHVVKPGATSGRIAGFYNQNAGMSGTGTGGNGFIHIGGNQGTGNYGVEIGFINQGVSPGYHLSDMVFKTTNVAGNPIERMRLDAYGNLGIGTSSPQALLDVKNGTTYSSSGTWLARVQQNTNIAGNNGLSVMNAWAADTSKIFECAMGWNGTAAGYYPVFTVDGLGQVIISPQRTEAVRIESTGNFVFKKSITETVFTLTGTALNPANGTIQTITLASNTTLTDSLASGQSIILGIDDGSAYTVTWPTITWTTTPAQAPTLATTGFTWVVLWKVGSTLYGKY